MSCDKLYMTRQQILERECIAGFSCLVTLLLNAFNVFGNFLRFLHLIAFLVNFCLFLVVFKVTIAHNFFRSLSITFIVFLNDFMSKLAENRNT